MRSRRSSPKTIRQRNTLFTFLLITAGFAIGFMLTPDLIQSNYQENQYDTPVWETDHISMSGQISEQTAADIADFVSLVLDNSYHPHELQFLPENSQQKPRRFTSSWSKGAILFTVLLDTDDESDQTRYLRLWTIDRDSSSIDEEYIRSSAPFLNESFLTTTGEITCDSKDGQTICSTMKTADSGDLFGITVRTPVPSVERAENRDTLLSVCLVPRAATSAYRSNICL